MDYEKEYINAFSDLQKYFVEANTSFIEQELLIEDAKKQLTLYDLRAFYSVMADSTDDGELKKLLKNMVKTLAKMEIFKKKVPPIMKLKSPSPTIKSYTKN